MYEKGRERNRKYKLYTFSELQILQAHSTSLEIIEVIGILKNFKFPPLWGAGPDEL
jgi:hypothetical protein